VNKVLLVFLVLTALMAVSVLVGTVVGKVLKDSREQTERQAQLERQVLKAKQEFREKRGFKDP
jgi:Na+-transporting methylmalonyl-CoA/oxaloacetate decarboxylase gamma subunit